MNLHGNMIRAAICNCSLQNRDIKEYSSSQHLVIQVSVLQFSLKEEKWIKAQKSSFFSFLCKQNDFTTRRQAILSKTPNYFFIV